MKDHPATSSRSRDDAPASKPGDGKDCDKSQSTNSSSGDTQANAIAKPTNAKSTCNETTNQGEKSADTSSPEETKSGDSKDSGACKSADAIVAQTTLDVVTDSSAAAPQPVVAPVTPVIAAPIAPALALPTSPEQTAALPVDSTKALSVDDKSNATKRASATQVTLQAQVTSPADACGLQDTSSKPSEDKAKPISGQTEPGDTQAASGSGKQQPVQSHSIRMPDGVKTDGIVKVHPDAPMKNGGTNAVNATSNVTVSDDAKNVSAKAIDAHADEAAEPVQRSDTTQPMLSMRFDSDIHLTDLTGSPQSQQIPVSQSTSAPNPSTPAAVLTPAAVPIAGLAVEIAGRALAGKNHFEIRLDPPELGRIDVHLSVDRDGQVTSHLVVDRTDTLNLLRQDSTGLERALQNAGLTTSGNGLQFSLRDQTMNQNSLPQPAPLPPTRVIVPDEAIAAVELTPRIYSRLAGMGAGLDIRV